MNAQAWIAFALGVAAIADDMKRRHIANWIPLAALVGGLGWQTGLRGWMGIPIALGGAATGFSVFLIFYWLGGMGGGDIKLMAGFGALLGAGRLLEAALWTAGVGGVMALGFLGWRALRKKRPSAEGAAPSGESIPYAPAIALGVWLALVPKG